MNWHKAKTILICFFVIVNAILLYFNFSGNKSSSYISSDIIAYTAEVLQRNGISIDTDIIPARKPTIPQYEADNIITDYESFAKLVLGDDLKKLTDTQFESRSGTLQLIGDTFLYTSSAPLFPSGSLKAGMISRLNKFGITSSDYEYAENENNAVVTNKTNGFEIFNSQIVLENTDECSRLSGAWFCRLGDNFPEAAKLKDITSVLIDLLSSPQKPAGEVTITNLTLGYMLYESETYHKTLVPIPVWRIEYTGGSAYMDARANS